MHHSLLEGTTFVGRIDRLIDPVERHLDFEVLDQEQFPADLPEGIDRIARKTY